MALSHGFITWLCQVAWSWDVLGCLGMSWVSVGFLLGFTWLRPSLESTAAKTTPIDCAFTSFTTKVCQNGLIRGYSGCDMIILCISLYHTYLTCLTCLTLVSHVSHVLHAVFRKMSEPVSLCGTLCGALSERLQLLQPTRSLTCLSCLRSS